MKSSAVPFPSPIERVQKRLLWLAGAFLLVYAILLTLAPAVKVRGTGFELEWRHWLGWLIWAVGFGILHHFSRRLAFEADHYLLPLVALLTGWGILTIFRLDFLLGLRQALWLVIGLGVVAYLIRREGFLQFLKQYRVLWLVGGLMLTALTLVFGTYPGGEGPRLWLGCCGIYLQPSEPLKLLLVVFLASYLAEKPLSQAKRLRLILPTLVLLALAIALLLIQRDLGTATLFILIYTLTLYLATGETKVLLFAGGALLFAGVAGVFAIDVVRYRVESWLNPWADPSGRSYQIIQSLIAIASGAVLGSGPGVGFPSVVPVAASDFIFTAIAEETGLIGVIGLLLAYALFLVRGIRIALFASRQYHRYLAAGVVAYFTSQVVLILAGNLRVLPLTGVTLPFLSYGGSSLLTSLLAAALLYSVSRDVREEPAPLYTVNAYLHLFTAGLILLGGLALVVGWWAVVRQDVLTARFDNPRQYLYDRYVQRGSIVDRNGEILVHSVGMPGHYQRVWVYPELANTLGYNHPLYGKTGLEASMNAYLRGLQGVPSSLIWWNRLLYSQPPVGLDVRITIDEPIQRAADALMGNHQGGLVVLNAQSGEILALVSHPTFDPNRLGETWQEIISDPRAPLVNRAVQGQYPVGSALAPLILLGSVNKTPLPEFPQELTAPCGLRPENSTWNAALSQGCSSALEFLLRAFFPTELDRFMRSLGLDRGYSLPIPVAAPQYRLAESPAQMMQLENWLQGSPLQMAVAVSALSNQGVLPSPSLVQAVHTPHQGWVVINRPFSSQVVSASVAQQAQQFLAMPGQLYWQTVAVVGKEQKITWMLGGTTREWKGAPVVIAGVLEEEDPQRAQEWLAVLFETILNSR
ncbi:FtsW/RodA/SpoVE family cell cycle protein [Anaerolinea thermophila]|uniref:Cell cycle protein n=1 Tax=Anaerolinea thermophila (strain DSM 14523 / JCM 11388 / NBRC 100420 / UNI-1) TaxID=926569 RepID=E8N410_ANATU|nr:FtsW/RodA/SpoVE family cell cycle protein [Anaerolinea thermophila]BAJ63174.1 cell cycle protein [Anaerolinea thermophila UNI-1]